MSKVRVAIRCRPSEEMPTDMRIGGNSISMCISGSTNDFQFDEVLDRRTTQDEVFRKCVVPIADKSLEGFNGCVFAYGQTGAGKTHTMTGPIIQSFEDRGVCMRTAGYLFDKLRKMPESNIVIRMSAIEIYNETLIDLFHKSTYNQSISEANPPKLVIADLATGVSVPALFLIPVDNEEDAYNLLLETFQNRMEAEHSLNRRSSRSHVIYTFYMTITSGKDAGSPSKSQATNSRRSAAEPTDVIQSKLHLVDLAGSERVHKTGSTGIVLKEAAHINKSLSFLEQVVLALTQKQREHIPYRQSKLTYLLKDSIGGNCNTTLIACIWPHTNYLFESLSTLRFATRMKCIENHPVRNSLFQKDSSNNTKLMLQIQLLKKELILRDMLSSSNISPLGGDAGMQTQVQGKGAQALVDNVATYARNEKEQFGGELSKGQRIKTARLVQALVLSNTTGSGSEPGGTGGCVNDSNGATQEPFPQLQVHSQAQARWLVYLMQQMVHNAVDGDPDKIQGLLQKTLSKCGMAIVLANGAVDGSAITADGLDDTLLGASVVGLDLEAEEANEANNMRQYENAIGNNKTYSKQNKGKKAGKPPTKKDPQTPDGDNSNTFVRKGSSRSQSRGVDGAGDDSIGGQFYPDPGGNIGGQDGGYPDGIDESPGIAGSNAGSRRQSRGGSSSSSNGGGGGQPMAMPMDADGYGHGLPNISRGGSARTTPIKPPGSADPLLNISPRRLDDGFQEQDAPMDQGRVNEQQQEQQEQQGSQAMLSFEEYTANDEQGQVLNMYYEESKKNLKQQKGNLKQLVASVNKKKYIIDGLTEDLKVAQNTDLNGSGSEEIDVLSRQLDQAKQSYKTVFNELAACREVLSEAQATKQQCMHTLINAYSAMSEMNNSSTGTNAGIV